MQFSMKYLIARALQLEGTYPGGTGGEPAWLISAQRIMAGWGMVPEEDWPGHPGEESRPFVEPPGIDAKAKANRIHSYQRVRTAEQCFRMMLRPSPVEVAVEITDQWFDAPRGVIEMPKSRDAIIGAHAFTIIGYSPDKDGFQFLNSWGREWGEQGLGVLPPAYFDEYFLEAWTSSFAPMMASSHEIGRKVLRWESPDVIYRGMRQYGVEVRDTRGDERIAWAFAVLRDGFLDVEELFVKPQYRRQGYGRRLTENLRELSWHVGRSIRLWVPFADYEPSNFPALARIAELLGVEFAESGVRWAALKAVASKNASRLFVPPSTGKNEGGNVSIPHVCVPKRPAMPKPRAPALAAAAVAAALVPNLPPTGETGVHGQWAAVTSTDDVHELIPEDEFRSIGNKELGKYAALYERFAAASADTKSDSSDAAACIPDDVFEAAAGAVFEKYADLYQRLA